MPPKQSTEQAAAAVLGRSEEILNRVRGPLARFAQEIADLLNLVSDVLSRRYPYVPWAIVAQIVAALVYVLSPIDAVPDVIPVLGLADDAAVVALLLQQIAPVLDAYRRWRGNQCAL